MLPLKSLRASGRRSAFGLATLVSVSLVGAGIAAAAPAPEVAVTAKVPRWPSNAVGLPAFLKTTPTKSTDVMEALLRSRLPARLRAGALGSNVSMRVQDLATGKVEFSWNGDRAMVPASTMKTATALAVLSALGANHAFTTRVLRSRDGSALTIVGGGDPLLSSEDLDRLARKTALTLLRSPATKHKIRVGFDDSLFAPPTLPPGWYSSYLSDYVTAPRALTRDLRRTSDGAEDAASYFRSRLAAHGMKDFIRKGVVRRPAPPGSASITGLRGHTVAEAVWPMLRYSDNSIAENLIRHVAIARGRRATPSGSAAAVTAELRRLGVPMGGARIVDGSGLSARDRLSTKTLVGIVRASMNPLNPDLSIAYRTLGMPVAGRTGTLTSRFGARKTRCAAGRIMAKTGTLTGVNALAGVAAGDDGRPRAFSIVVNDRPGNVSIGQTLFRLDHVATAVTGCG